MNSGLLKRKMDLSENLPMARGPETRGDGPESEFRRNGRPEACVAAPLDPDAAAASPETELQLQSQPCRFWGPGVALPRLLVALPEQTMLVHVRTPKDSLTTM